jgi:anti-sigma-K factor RskA
MSPERDHEEIEELLAAFVLGATDPEEDDLVRAHLEGCSTCTSTVRRLRETLSAVPLATETAQPPPRLREQILSAAGVSRQPEPAALRKARVLSLRPPRIPIRPARAGWGAAVAAAAIVAFALGAGLGLGVGRVLAPQPAPVSAVAQYSLNGSGAMAGAQGRVFELEPQGLTLVEFSNLPALDAGKVYELWLIPAAGQPIPGAVFKPDPSGGYVVLLARNLNGLTALAVTAEAGPNGASAPSQQPELVGKVA